MLLPPSPSCRSLAGSNAATPIRVAVRLPSALWNQLLVAALNQVPGLAASCQPSERLAPPAAALAAASIVIAGVPTSRGGWERLRHWCRRSVHDGVGEGAGEPAMRVLVLGENRPTLAARALRLGACGYLDWESPVPVLVKAIRGVHAGELWAERRVALSLIRSPERAGDGRLTPRELHVLEYLAEGKRNKEIAEAMAISETTVKSHLNRAYHKLHLSDRLQAALYVERHGLDPGD